MKGKQPGTCGKVRARGVHCATMGRMRGKFTPAARTRVANLCSTVKSTRDKNSISLRRDEVTAYKESKIILNESMLHLKH